MNAASTAPLRVFQVATGNVGTEMIKRIGGHPDLLCRRRSANHQQPERMLVEHHVQQRRLDGVGVYDRRGPNADPDLPPAGERIVEEDGLAHLNW